MVNDFLRQGKYQTERRTNTVGQTITWWRTHHWALEEFQTHDSCIGLHITDSLALLRRVYRNEIDTNGMRPETAVSLTDNSTVPPFEWSQYVSLSTMTRLFTHQKHTELFQKICHFTGFLYILARKYLSDESFLLAFGFRVRTLLNTLESLSWSLWTRTPSQYLHTSEPPGCKIFSAKSIKDKHIVTSFSWSISRKPLALGAMSLRMTWDWWSGSSSSSLTCVAGSVTSWLHRKWAPSRGGIFSRSTPTTVPRGNSGSRVDEKYISSCCQGIGWRWL